MRRHHHQPALAAAAVLALAAASPARAQWTLINLHPAGAAESEVRAIHGAQQVGYSNSFSNALLWSGSALSVKRLNPTNGQNAAGYGVTAGQQGGTVHVGTGVDGRTHAALWSGTPDSLLDLHPGPEVAVHTNIAAIIPGTQVGSFLGVDGGGGTFSGGRACLWHGTPESFVDLTPPGYTTGEARGAFGDQQVGATFENFFGAACMWTGTAESFVNLQPEEALFSSAECTDGTHQYGVIGVLEPVAGLYPARWSGTADSWIDLGIPAERWGEVHGVFEGYAVGYITDTDGISNSRACVWPSGQGSYVDLQQFLPAPLTESNALGVWRHTPSGTTYVVGWGLNNSTTRREALMWVNGPDVNLITSAAAPADDSAAVGQPLVYTIRVLNAGPVAAAAATLTIDLPSASTATFAGAVPAPSSTTATQLTFNLGSLAGSGAFTDITLTLTAAGAGSTAAITATASAALEADPTNNAATVSSRILGQACAADFNNNGDVTVQDIFDFLAAYFASDIAADFNASGSITVQDIFDFLNAYFIGC